MAVTIYMGLNVDTMISKFGLLGFFSFFQNWLTYGNLFFVILLIAENILIWFLKRRVKYAENDRDDLIIRVNDLRKQVNELKKQNTK
jgi:type II secretory pathway component PulF